MMNIPPGYAFLDNFGNPGPFDLYRASRIRDNRRVLIKTSPIRYVRHGETLFRHLAREYEFCSSGGVSGIVRALDLVKFGDHAALVLEDEGGDPLHRILAAGPPGLESTLAIAMQLAKILFDLHHDGLIHQSIRPSNILVTPGSLATRITGLGMATRIPRSWSRDISNTDLENELAYISPEQTGRTNRLVDYRTDFYSLGITLYKTVTGRLPFPATDVLDLVHAHLAMDPPDPAAGSPGVPHSLSRVILKLMSKEAESRYQGGLGLLADLEQCRRESTAAGGRSRFALGEHDFPDRFELPQKLYGRDAEIRKLTQGFDAACDGSPRLILVSGYSGVGKTSLIHEFGKTVFLRRGHFASGRYGRQERSIPYSGILEAARNLVRRLLGESPEHFSSLRKKLSDALGSNIGVLVDVIPEMGAILGDFQQPVILGPTESRNRFHNCMLQFFEIAAREAPLVLFLDDLQWADQPSLELIEGLLLQKAPACLLVGSYRDNEVDGNHPLVLALERIRSRGLLAEMLAILPLGSRDVLQLVADTLRAGIEHARPLADLVFQKTAGNPFFVKSFMASLHVEGHLKFLPESGWTWDLAKVAEAGATENVIDFTARKIDALPVKIRETISLAAALGGRFDTQSISEVSRLPIEEIRAHLIHGSRERILVKREDHFEFEHDRIREGAYGFIPESAREATHLNIGRLLAKKLEGEADDSGLFESVNHLNSALRIIGDRSERMEIARLNQRAGRKAKSGGAFQAAFRYFAAGLSLLDDAAWNDHYLLALDIHSESAEAAFLNADFEEVDRLVAIVLPRAHSVLDRISAYETQIGAAYARRREGEALAIMLDVLKQLGIEVPFHPSVEDVDRAIRDVHSASKKMLEGSLSPRIMDDPVRLAATRLLVRAAFSAGWTNLSMYWLIVGKIVDLTVRYGHGPEAPVAYVMAGSIIACEFKEYEDARTIGSVGLALCENPRSIHWRAMCQYLFNLDIVSHVEHFPSLFHRFAKVHRIALEGGDLVSASTSAFFHCHIGLHMGMELHKLEGLIRTYFEEATTFCVNRVTAGLHQLQQTILLLMGTEPVPDQQFTRWNVSADVNLRTWHGEADQTPQELTYSNRMMIQYFLRDSRGAWDSACIADTLPEGGAASVIPSDFYICLCFLDIASDASDGLKDRVRNTIAPRLENLGRMAQASPMNHGHKMDLVEAERQRVFGSPLMAMGLYEKAIEGARKQGFVNDEAIGNELAAEFYLSMNNLSVATMYLQEAESAYERWGAGRKILQLQEKYRYLLSPHFAYAKPAGLTLLDTDEEATSPPVFLDTSSFEKAASALAGELDLSRLIRKLMAILLQNTGAQRGFLLREEEGVTLIVASGSVDDQGVDVLRWDSLESSEELSQNIVRYVQRSHESVVIGDAVHNDQFAGDPYIERRHPLSILCTPILHRGTAVAILYLENNRMCDAFVGDRLAAVQFISSQAAVALENAQLHESLMREVVVRRTAEEELRKALGEVAQLKDRLEAENLYLREELQDSHSFKELVGRSPMLMDVLRKADQVASTGATVLILGETGTGKELVAREIHSRSTRKDRPLVKVNCAALPGPLIESELFGHEKGAFTGAIAKKIGRFELADGGTIFLDEVGDLPLDLQAKLLRVLQEGEFERLGSNRTMKVDVRVIAATNRDLKGAAVQGVFRPDLYYRLSVFPIQLPSLRERREDVPMLVRHFLKKKQNRLGKNIEKIPARIMDQLTSYHWPGNVRELENVIERAIILSPGPALELEESLLHVPGGAGDRAAEPGPRSLEEAERTHILAVLEQCGWKIKGSGNTASQLGLNPSTLYFRMKKLGIRRPAGTA